MKNNLKKILEEKGMTQSELARLSGLDKSTISRYIKYNRTPHGDNLVKIAKVLGVKIERILNI